MIKSFAVGTYTVRQARQYHTDKGWTDLPVRGVWQVWDATGQNLFEGSKTDAITEAKRLSRTA